MCFFHSSQKGTLICWEYPKLGVLLRVLKNRLSCWSWRKMMKMFWVSCRILLKFNVVTEEYKWIDRHLWWSWHETFWKNWHLLQKVKVGSNRGQCLKRFLFPKTWSTQPNACHYGYWEVVECLYMAHHGRGAACTWYLSSPSQWIDV